MKKLLVFFMVLFGISLGAMANFEGALIDPKGKDGHCVYLPDDFNDDTDYYAVYFKTGEHEPTPECANYFTRVKDALATLYADGSVARFVVVGSADKQGDNNDYNNAELSKRRLDYVKKNILPDNAFSGRGYVTGSASDRVFYPNKNAVPYERAVSIHPVWARFECDESLVSGINDNIAKLEKAKKDYPKQANEIDKILANYNNARELCPEVDKKLGAGDAEILAKYLNDAFSLASNLKINIGITEVTINSTDIDTHYYNLTRMVSGLKLSVWRDENGNFNTARLISDSVAGVVLGTVGGIVTSKLVKKNQLKKGFEDLYCAIGGQTVAEYGDDFTVGMR